MIWGNFLLLSTYSIYYSIYTMIGIGQEKYPRRFLNNNNLLKDFIK